MHQETPHLLRKESVLFTKYMIFPMTADGDLYSLQDTQGKQIAMGSREVCQTLLLLVTNSFPTARPPQLLHGVNPKQHISARQEHRE